MTWFILALGAALFWGVSQVFIKRGFRDISPLWTNIFSGVVALVVWVPTVLFLLEFKLTVPPFPVLLPVLLVVAFNMFYYYAISKGKLVLTGTVVAAYPLATIFWSAIFLAERLEVLQWLGVALMISGGIVVSLPEKQIHGKNNFSWLWWGLAGAAFLGTGDFLSKVVVNRIGAYSYIFFNTIFFNLLLLANYLVDKKGRALPKFSWKKFLPSILGVTLLSTGTLLFYLAFDYGKVSLITPISSIYPAITVFLAIIFLKEKISQRQSLGIVGIILGLILVGLKLG